jgi:hypothetical protein
MHIFSSIEEKAGRETAEYEGGTSSNFSRIFLDFGSELIFTNALSGKIIARSWKENGSSPVCVI